MFELNTQYYQRHFKSVCCDEELFSTWKGLIDGSVCKKQRSVQPLTVAMESSILGFRNAQMIGCVVKLSCKVMVGLLDNRDGY